MGTLRDAYRVRGEVIRVNLLGLSRFPNGGKLHSVYFNPILDGGGGGNLPPPSAVFFNTAQKPLGVGS